MEIEPISAAQQSLGKIFSDDYAFTIPPYQLPYAWEDSQARELLDDIQAALEDALSTKDPVTYFLGSIVLIKKPGAPLAQVVDGQQRLATLTILLAVLRDLSAGNVSRKRHAYICEEGDPDRGTSDRFRLVPRSKDIEFFRSHIQEEGATEALQKKDADLESQKNMVMNAILFRKALEEWSPSQRDNLVAFILQRCYLVVISVTNVELAHRVFTVLNARGLDLTPADILKADLLDRVSQGNEEKFSLEWEALETALGRERFVELFQHIRMIYQREKPRERLEVGFPKFVEVFKSDPDAFMRNVLLKFGGVYQRIITPAEVEQKYGVTSRNLVASLLRLDNSDWLPVAIDYLSRERVAKAQVETFLWALERVAYFMFVMRHDINTRITRYAKAITQLQKGIAPDATKSDLMLTAKEKLEFLTELDGPIYEKARVRLPLLLRLDASFTDGGASYDHGIITVEHVMPQNPRADSPWLSMFDDEEERDRWTHCLGNCAAYQGKK